VRKFAIGTAVALVLALAAPGTAAVAAQPATGHAPKLPKLVTLKNIRKHQQALQTIATANGGTRASGEPGFTVSKKYVVDQLKRAGYHPKVQDFPFDYWKETATPVLEQTAPEAKKYQPTTDFQTMQFSGSGDVSGTVTAVDPGATSGCEAADFSGFPSGGIALITRGTCDFGVKADNAVRAGAKAVLIYNDGTAPDRMGPVAGTLGKPFAIPVLTPSYAVGTALVAAAKDGGLKMHASAATINDRRTTSNVTADTPAGRGDNVVVVGAHLDSVTAGPGINDNGSGSATLLAMAQQFHKLGKVKNKVRFAWWGAEENGLIGSTYYVEHLTAAQKNKIALDLNFDMLGSPNYVRFVYDGDAEGAPAGSGAIKKAFTDYYTSRGLPVVAKPFDGRSDYGPFIDAGIPAGGVESGAEGVKTAEEAKIYGGTAGRQYDPCYHQACDTYGNVSTKGLDELSDGAAFATETFARSTLPVNGVERAPAAKAAAHPARVGDLFLR
jgi:Zn-dependent M28 family amino/carboxypeptidase